MGSNCYIVTNFRKDVSRIPKPKPCVINNTPQNSQHCTVYLLPITIWNFWTYIIECWWTNKLLRLFLRYGDFFSFNNIFFFIFRGLRQNGNFYIKATCNCAYKQKYISKRWNLCFCNPCRYKIILLTQKLIRYTS